MTPTCEPMRIPIVFTDGDAALSAMVARAMSSARAAQTRWSRTPVVRRLKLVCKLRQLIAENASRLAEASAEARQRPMLESLTAEVLPLAEACRFLERHAESGRARPAALVGWRAQRNSPRAVRRGADHRPGKLSVAAARRAIDSGARRGQRRAAQTRQRWNGGGASVR